MLRKFDQRGSSSKEITELRIELRYIQAQLAKIAMWIMKYTEKIADKPFKQIGEQMLATCFSFLGVRKKNRDNASMSALIFTN